MKSKLNRIVAVSVTVLALGSAAAPAYADVATGGRSTGVVSGHHPFVAGRWAGFASTSHVHTARKGFGWATSTAVGGGESHLVVIR
ncbi:hypothetical protein ABR738_36510 [Streptomyces sp. Edi4]|uniref:hypothetical protein n=1 Tax=Streptomyces sp. Edi4 TaxID=3162527 RepID=UPI00330568AE